MGKRRRIHHEYLCIMQKSSKRFARKIDMKGQFYNLYYKLAVEDKYRGTKHRGLRRFSYLKFLED